MIRILRVISRMNVGGPARCVLNLTAGLGRAGFETVVAAGAPGPGEGDLSDLVAECGGIFRRIPGLKRSVAPLGDLRALRHLASLIRSYRPHIVHTHASKGGFLGRIAALSAGRGAGRGRQAMICHTFHGHVLDGYFGPLKSAFYREAERWLAARTDIIIAVAASVRQELLDRHGVGRPAQYRVIPSGAHGLIAPRAGGEAHSLQAAPDLNWRAGPKAAVIGRFAPVKGHDVLLAALPALVADVPELQIILVGDGPMRGRFEQAAARSPAARQALRFLGQRQDIAQILASVDFLLLPSRKEGLPTVLIEAAAAGVPIAASAIPGVTDFLQDETSALLFEPGSPQALHDAAVRLCRDSALRARLAAAGRSAAARIMSPEEVVAAHADLYKKLCGEVAPEV